MTRQPTLRKPSEGRTIAVVGDVYRFLATGEDTTGEQADHVFRIDTNPSTLLHLELEGNPRLGIPREMKHYNTFVDQQNNLPVGTVLVLLRNKAQPSDQDGFYQRLGVRGNVIATFRYHIVRVCEQPIEFWLNGGPGLAPLALITREADANLEDCSLRHRGMNS